MTGGVLLMVVPWVLFAGAVATIGVLVARRKPNWQRGGQPGGHRESGKHPDCRQCAAGQEAGERASDQSRAGYPRAGYPPENRR